MLYFSVFPMAIRIETQDCISRLHNLKYWIPFLKSDISMNLLFNSLMFYVNLYLFKDGQNLSPLPCYIFPYFELLSERELKTAYLDYIT